MSCLNENIFRERIFYTPVVCTADYIIYFNIVTECSLCRHPKSTPPTLYIEEVRSTIPAVKRNYRRRHVFYPRSNGRIVFLQNKDSLIYDR